MLRIADANASVCHCVVIATLMIFTWGLGDGAGAAKCVRAAEVAVDSENAILSESTKTPNSYLPSSVPDIDVRTIVGNLPHLPYTISAEYPDGQQGPPVRVLWPSPTNNQQVLQPGSYSLTGIVPGTEFRPRATVTVTATDGNGPVPVRELESFPLGDVLLNLDTQQRETPFIMNRNKFLARLVETDPDSFLYMFRDAFGQVQPDGARPLGVWDSQTTKLRGHATGHYLSALAQAYASTSYDKDLQATFRKKMETMITTLHELSRSAGKPRDEGASAVADPTQVPPAPGKDGYSSDLTSDGIRHDYWNWGTGFISAYPPDQFIMLEQGAKYGGKDDNIWAPYYTLHKILAGLLDCYEVGGNEKALEISRGMADWVYARLKNIPTETRINMWNRYIAGEYGGMNEVMARLYRLTDDQRYLECAKLFDNVEFFFGDAEHSHGLARNVDLLRGKHANQHVPQITGALETYRMTNDISYYHVATNFWEICTHCYMYSIGGVAGASTPDNAECFTAEPNTLFSNGFARGGQNETCATYNMLKLTRQLFMYQHDAKYMDYYEQALYNHILASVAERDPGNTYHVPLNPGARKDFGNANMNGFTCCNGTALESNTKLQDSIYFRDQANDAIFVNLFVPSSVRWQQRGVTITQKTDFPYSDRTQLVVAGHGEFTIHLRVPSWATKGYTVLVNDKRQQIEAIPGSYVAVRRDWQDGDIVELQMPFAFRLSPVMDKPNIASIFYGPILLAAEEPERRNDWRPLTLDHGDLANSFEGSAQTLRFSAGDTTLKPFYETYTRHSVYFDVSWK
ncbi:MAG: glycoside hydrolase family 127 protein [Planctomycetales bacterium]|nr:glycoside hydrolase family 127 protein [Planctomycetales bacterium]